MIGMMGAGKTAVGAALAQRLHVPFIDSDAEIERAANLTIAEIFERDGETFFREKEAQVLKRLLDGPPLVLSTGGGAWLRAENRRTILAAGVAVWLDVDRDLLWSRVRHKTTRPLLRTPNPRQTLADLIEARAPVYATAPVRVKAEPRFTVEDTTARVLAALAEHGDVVSE